MVFEKFHSRHTHSSTTMNSHDYDPLYGYTETNSNGSSGAPSMTTLTSFSQQLAASNAVAVAGLMSDSYSPFSSPSAASASYNELYRQCGYYAPGSGQGLGGGYAPASPHIIGHSAHGHQHQLRSTPSGIYGPSTHVHDSFPFSTAHGVIGTLAPAPSSLLSLGATAQTLQQQHQQLELQSQHAFLRWVGMQGF